MRRKLFCLIAQTSPDSDRRRLVLAIAIRLWTRSDLLSEVFNVCWMLCANEQILELEGNVSALSFLFPLFKPSVESSFYRDPAAKQSKKSGAKKKKKPVLCCVCILANKIPFVGI